MRRRKISFEFLMMVEISAKNWFVKSYVFRFEFSLTFLQKIENRKV